MPKVKIDAQRLRKTYSTYRVPPRDMFYGDVSQETIDKIDWKQSVKVATTVPLTSPLPTRTSPSGGVPLIVDGYTLVSGDRILIKDQSTASQNGIYVYQTLGGSLYWFERPDDAKQGTLSAGTAVYVEQGIENKTTGWFLTTADPIDVDVTSLIWEKFYQSGIFTTPGPGDLRAKTQYSVSFDSDNRYPDALGSDVFFYVSGSIDAIGSQDRRAVFGGDVVVSGSLRQGYVVEASGQYSHAEGYLTTGSSDYSHAEGYRSSADGQGSHAEGNNTVSTGNYSHAEGEFTIALGQSSHAEGRSTTATGDWSHAEGRSSSAVGQYSHVEGYQTSASGSYSHAEGRSTTSVGDFSHSEGFLSTTQATYSHAEGYSTVTSGSYSHAEGFTTTARGSSSHAEGRNTVSNASYSHSEGYASITSGSYSHSEGYSTIARGNSSHSEGYYTVALGDYSHAEGNNSLSKGNYSHAEGYLTTGSADYSHAEGYLSFTSGTYSHAEGIGTITSGSGQHAGGKYNLRNNDFSLFVIGDGSGDDDSLRHDVLRVNSGSVEVTGSLLISGNITAVGGDLQILPSSQDVSPGSDVFFYVSGSISGSGAYDKKTVFGGDVRVSGTLAVGTGSVYVTSNDIQFGNSTTKIEKDGSGNLKFYDASNASGKTLTSMGGGGISALPPSELCFFAGVFSVATNSTTRRVGSRKINMASYPATIGTLSRTVKFFATIEATTVTTTATIRLKDVTNNVTVTGTQLTTTSTTASEVSSAALTVGSSSGNIRSDSAAMYEVQLEMTGGGVSDSVTCTDARVIISYA